jgi:hypothetical protein
MKGGEGEWVKGERRAQCIGSSQLFSHDLARENLSESQKTEKGFHQSLWLRAYVANLPTTIYIFYSSLKFPSQLKPFFTSCHELRGTFTGSTRNK